MTNLVYNEVDQKLAKVGKGLGMTNNTEIGSLEIIELDERLEFSAAVIESDLDSDDNSNCTNNYNCSAHNAVSCTNELSCS